MKMHIECLPCVLNQTIEASKVATDNEKLQEEILEEGIKLVEDYKNYCCMPDIISQMHELVKKISGKADPYKKIKEEDIKTSLKLYPFLEKVHLQNNESLHSALKISATGNIIDSAFYSDLDISSSIEEEIVKPFGVVDLDKLEEKLVKGKKVLIIGDNSGETVFDILLIKSLGLDVTYSVREHPVANDATLQEAYASGLENYAKLISSGSGVPGTIIKRCSKEFQSVFYGADIVISKGQGNYDSLKQSNRDIFFLLKAKCKVAASELGVHMGEYVFKYKE